MDKMSFVQNFLAKAKYSYDYDAGAGIGFLAFFFWFFLMAGIYLYGALTLMLIAKKTNTSNSWMAWVPFLNLYLAVKIAGKSLIWFIMFFLPFLNVVASVVIWAAISEKRGKPAWWGLLTLVPVANFVIMGILAFSGGKSNSPKKRKSSSTSSESCSKCGASVTSNDKFCPDCGAEIVKKSGEGFCSKCGASITPNDKFCPDCGAKT